jgi:iron complex outermembrane receptor protein
MRRLLPALCVLLPVAATAQTETVVVYGTLASSDIGLAREKVPGTLQSLSSGDLSANRGATVLDGLGTGAAGVNLNDVQGNGAFQDLRFHGFSASPLQGTPQGVAVFQNGVRLNEAFGDTVNWDTIPETAVRRLDLWSNNPVFGLNALGGAVNLVMKDGFTAPGGELSASGGSYGHAMATAEYGMQDGDFALYGAAEGGNDSGWRLHSASNLGRVYGDAGWRFGDSEIHLVASGALTQEGVVGPAPIELAAANSKAVYTSPQTTHNATGTVALNAKTKLADHWQLETGAYLRGLRQRHVDGNDANFESCSTRSSYGGFLCLQDDEFGTPPGGKTTAFRDQFVLMNPAGQTIPFKNGVVYGTIDRTYTDTVSEGVTLQLTSDTPLGKLSNYFTVGGSIDHSAIGFRSGSSLGLVNANFVVAPDPSLPGAGSIVHTRGSLGYAPVTLAGNIDYYGFYAVDALDLTPALTVTAGFRINSADIATRDRSGLASELTGTHGYSHLNPLAGATYKIADELTFFGGYSEANRAPTPLELDCADRTLPCLLEGSLVSDPPLAQVVAHTYEAGLRGKLEGVSWSASLFRTDSDNDIVALASVIQGRGYYANVPLTRRQGVDITGDYAGDGWSAHAGYSYLDATYEFTGPLPSANNPQADANGNVTVTPGRHIPLNPSQQFKLGADAELVPGFMLGGDLVARGSAYYDGDNANQNAKLPASVRLNLRAAYNFMAGWQLFGVADNVLNQHKPAFGTYFQPDDTLGLVTPALSDPRTVTLPQPVSFQIGLKTSF